MSEAISMLRPACGKNLLLSVHMLAAYEYGRVNLKEQTGEIGGHDERAVMGRRRWIGRRGTRRNFFVGIVRLDRCVQGVVAWATWGNGGLSLAEHAETPSLAS